MRMRSVGLCGNTVKIVRWCDKEMGHGSVTMMELSGTSKGQPYTFCISHFVSVFAKHITKYETLIIYLSYFMWISCFINTTKKYTMKSFDFSRECHSWYEMRKAKKGKRMRKKWREIPHYTLFVFHISWMFSRISRKVSSGQMSYVFRETVNTIPLTSPHLTSVFGPKKMSQRPAFWI